MRDLVQLTDARNPDLTAREGLRVTLAMLLASASGILALRSLAPALISADIPPLPGMHSLAGQIAWPAVVVAMLIAVRMLVRGVIQRRLQWAVGLSLLVHLLMSLFAARLQMNVRGPHPESGARRIDLQREEFTLPDYANSEFADEEPVWAQPADVTAPERPLQPEHAEIRMAAIPRDVVTEDRSEQPPEPSRTPERQEDLELKEESEKILRQDPSVPETDPVEVVEAEVVPVQDSDPELESAPVDARSEQQLPEIQKARAETTSAPASAPSSIERQLRDQRPAIADSAPEQTAIKGSSAQATLDRAEIPALSKAASVSSPNVEAASESSPNRRSSVRLTPSRAPVSPESLARGTDSDAPGATAVQRAVARTVAETTPSSGSMPIVRRAVRIAADESAGGESADVPATHAASSSGTPEVQNVRAASGSNARAARDSSAGLPQSAARRGSSSAAAQVREFEGTVGLASGSRRAGSSRSNAEPQLSDAAGGARSVSDHSGESGFKSGRRTIDSTVMEGVTSAGNVAAARESTAESGAEALLSGPRSGNRGRSVAALPGGSVSNGAAGSAAFGRGRTGASGFVTPSTESSAGTGSKGAGSNGRSDSELLVGSSVTSGLARGRRGTGEASLGEENPLDGLSRAGAGNAVRGLPEGVAELEQSGNLVNAGPQAPASGGTPEGPRSLGTGRRSAGLPGVSGRPSASGSLVAGEPEVTTSLSGRVSGSKRLSGSTGPVLDSANVIAGLVRKSASGRIAHSAAVPESLSMRNADARKAAARTLGGSDESEEAVERGLEWLVRHQHADGHWSLHDIAGDGIQPRDNGSFHSDTAATGLALLAFLGAGYTHESDKFQEVVSRGMQWLLSRQKPNGDLFSDKTEFVWFYSHGIASIALCEAYGLTKDPALQEPAQRALDFIVQSQHPQFGGWRYQPRFETDTSVSGWQLMALKSGEMAGLKVPPAAYGGVRQWLAKVRRTGGQFAYHPSKPVTPAMTAEGLLMRQYLGATRDDGELIDGANYLRVRTPDSGQRDAYYWYYATQVMFHMQGEYWSEWNNHLRDLLVSTQSTSGSSGGSWDPQTPTREKWASAGGRHYLTCLNLLMLEVYYRHLPLYLELQK